MADANRLEQAFMAAHSAGDTASASMFAAELQKMRAAPQAAPEPQGDASQGGIGAGMMMGAKDPINAGAQMLVHALPKGVVDAGNQFNNWLADKGMPGIARIPEGGVDQMIRQDDAAYEQNRKAAGRDGIDFARMGGNVAATLPAALATGGASLGSAVASGAGFGVLQPTQAKDFWAEKAKQAGIGGALGGVGGLVAKGLGKVINPQTGAEQKALMAGGVDLTPGQIAGGMAKKFEDSATSVPIAGSMIDKAKKASIESFNRATYNKVLEPIGVALPDGLVGRDAAKFVSKALGDQYDAILPNMPAQMDNQFAAQARFITSKIGELPDGNAAQFSRIVKDNLVRHVDQSGAMTGEGMKTSVSELNRLGAKYMGSQSAGDQEMGRLLMNLKGAVVDMASRANPQLAPELAKVDKGWAMYVRTRTAAAALGAEDGVFTPAQLLNAVKVADKSGNKAAFSKGDALLQAWAEAGKKVLPSKVGDSGTAGRVGVGALLTGGAAGGMIDPITAGASIGGLSALYSQFGQKAARAALTKRPASAGTIADLIQRGAPLPLTAGGYELLQ